MKIYNQIIIVYFTCEMKRISLWKHIITQLNIKKLHWKCWHKYSRLISSFHIWYKNISKWNVIIKLCTCEIKHKFSQVNLIKSNYGVIN
jgi:hypothetical protein